MGTRENNVETYFDDEVKRVGGMTRKWVSPGHSGVPDRIVIIKGHVWFVEIKTSDGIVSTPQQREINRLRKHGAAATVVRGHTGVDSFIREAVRDINPRTVY